MRRVRRVLTAAFALTLSTVGATAVASTGTMTRYAIVQRIAGPANVVAWDYVTVDSRLQRLFMATLQSQTAAHYTGGITAVALRSGTVTGRLVKDAMPHEVVILGKGMAAAADAGSHGVLFFDETTGRIRARVLTGGSRDGWHDPDSLLREPGTPLLVAVNHDSGVLVLVDSLKRLVVGRIRVGGVLEAATAGSRGTVFVNVASRGTIAVVDLPGRRVVRELPMGGCREPTGIGFDAADRLVISVCSNGIAKFLDPHSGVALASIPVGKGADGVIYDKQRKLVFIAGGLNGTLSIIRIRSRNRIELVQSVSVPVGTRLGALDRASGKVYLPSANYDRTAPRLRIPGLPPLPRIEPGSFALLVLAPIGPDAMLGPRSNGEKRVAWSSRAGLARESGHRSASNDQRRFALEQAPMLQLMSAQESRNRSARGRPHPTWTSTQEFQSQWPTFQQPRGP